MKMSSRPGKSHMFAGREVVLVILKHLDQGRP